MYFTVKFIIHGPKVKTNMAFLGISYEGLLSLFMEG